MINDHFGLGSFLWYCYYHLLHTNFACLAFYLLQKFECRVCFHSWYIRQSWKGSFTRQSYMENGSYGRFTNSLIWTNSELRTTKCNCQTGWKSRYASAKLHNTVKYCCWPVRDGTDTTTPISPKHTYGLFKSSNLRNETMWLTLSQNFLWDV